MRVISNFLMVALAVYFVTDIFGNTSKVGAANAAVRAEYTVASR